MIAHDDRRREIAGEAIAVSHIFDQTLVGQCDGIGIHALATQLMHIDLGGDHCVDNATLGIMWHAVPVQ